MSGAPKSKTLATWLALLGGVFGLHRFYLHGFRDRLGWLHPVPTLLGWHGVVRLREYGVDDRLAGLLLPMLGLMLALAMLTAIVHGLTPDERWNLRYNPARPAAPSGWGVVLGVIVALAVGATALLSTIAYTAQRLFERQAAALAGASLAPPARLEPAAAARPGPHSSAPD